MTAIEATGLMKTFRLYPSARARLKELLGGGKAHKEFVAVQDVTFSVAKGETVGIIGQNGSGKSTLLEMVAGVLRPTAGRVSVKGRVSALLELGAGFNPEFTGRENVLMNGAMVGVGAAEMREKLKRVEEFAEIGEFLDQPVRTYSSGMFVRLAFSAAINLDPEILLIDEALSVGDIYFQHKCFEKLRDFKKAGATLLFVSHDPSAVKLLCDRVLLMDGGKLLRDDRPDAAYDYYNALVSAKEASGKIRQSVNKGRVETRSGSQEAVIESVEIRNEKRETVSVLKSGDRVSIEVAIRFNADVDAPCVGILIKDRFGNDVFGTNTEFLAGMGRDYRRSERVVVSFSLPVQLGAGHYSVSVAAHRGATHLDNNFDWWDGAFAFEVAARDRSVGSVWLPVECRVERTQFQGASRE